MCQLLVSSWLQSSCLQLLASSVRLRQNNHNAEAFLQCYRGCYRTILWRQYTQTRNCASSSHDWRPWWVSWVFEQLVQTIIVKTASSHERALARAHVGVYAGLRPMRTAQHSRPLSVEQDVRIPARRSTARRKKWRFWSPVGGAISMCKFGHMYAFFFLNFFFTLCHVQHYGSRIVIWIPFMPNRFALPREA